MATPTILTCAVTGNQTTRAQHPRLPITPKEIATAIDEAKAGAAAVHLHARDPETGRGSMNLALFREIVGRIRDSGTDVILNLSTGEGGRFLPSDDDPSVAAPGTTLTRPEKRVVHVEDLKPDICTLDFNTMFSGSGVVINTPRNLEIMAQRIYAAGVLSEIEIFDTGDLQLATSFIERGLLKSPVLFQLVLGVRYGAVADPQTLAYYAARLPKDAKWAGLRHRPHGVPDGRAILAARRPRACRPRGQRLHSQGRAGARQCRTGREGGRSGRDAGRSHRDGRGGAGDPRPMIGRYGA